RDRNFVILVSLPNHRTSGQQRFPCVAPRVPNHRASLHPERRLQAAEPSTARPPLEKFLLRPRWFGHNGRMEPGTLFNLSGEVAVVIGGTGVLGGELASGLAEAGASVAVVGRNAERGQTRVQAITAQGGKAGFFAADAVDKQTLERAHGEIAQGLGLPTILVN